jgi:4-amino-4-deoxy-L-arabinose transferase-like glycosyltransferase
MRLSVFVFFAALYVATAAGHIYTIDGYLNYAVTRSIGTRGSLEIPKHMMTVEGRGGRNYSKLGVAQSLVSLPLFWTGSLVERVSPGNRVFSAYADLVSIPYGSGTLAAEPQDLIRVSDVEGARVFFATLTNALITALVCLIFWSLLRRYGLPRKAALLATCLLGFATPYWIYARDYFAEPLFAACLLAAFYLVTDPAKSGAARRAALAGLVAGLGILTRPSFAPLAAILAAYLVLASGDRRWGLAQAGWFALGCLPGAALTAGLNAYRFGGIFTTGYHTAFDKGFSLPLAKGILWNLASPYRSILLYAPAVLVFAFGIREFVRKHRGEAWLAVAIIAYIFITYSKWWAWHGGWCWGPRFLLPAIPLLLIPGLVAARTRRWLAATAAALGLAGLAVQLSAVLINYTAPYDYWIKIKKLDWGEAGIEKFSPIWVHFQALSTTSARQYDLWLVQASRVIGWNVIWIAIALVAVAWIAATRILRPAISK